MIPSEKRMPAAPAAFMRLSIQQYISIPLKAPTHEVNEHHPLPSHPAGGGTSGAGTILLRTTFYCSGRTSGTRAFLFHKRVRVRMQF